MTDKTETSDQFFAALKVAISASLLAAARYLAAIIAAWMVGLANSSESWSKIIDDSLKQPETWTLAICGVILAVYRASVAWKRNKKLLLSAKNASFEKFRLQKDTKYGVDGLTKLGEFDLPFLNYKDGVFTAKAGFEWDGCSFKYALGPFVSGISDGPLGPDGLPITWMSSLKHDQGYANIVYLSKFFGMSPWTVKALLDEEFKRNLEAVGFEYAKTYYKAVRWVGWIMVLMHIWEKK
jgi:hypothetical protein